MPALRQGCRTRSSRWSSSGSSRCVAERARSRRVRYERSQTTFGTRWTYSCLASRGRRSRKALARRRRWCRRLGPRTALRTRCSQRCGVSWPLANTWSQSVRHRHARPRPRRGLGHREGVGHGHPRARPARRRVPLRARRVPRRARPRARPVVRSRPSRMAVRALARGSVGTTLVTFPRCVNRGPATRLQPPTRDRITRRQRLTLGEMMVRRCRTLGQTIRRCCRTLEPIRFRLCLTLGQTVWLPRLSREDTTRRQRLT